MATSARALVARRRLVAVLASPLLIGAGLTAVQSSATAAPATTTVRATARDAAATLRWSITPNGHRVTGVYVGRARTVGQRAWKSGLLRGRTGRRAFPHLRNGTTYTLFVQPVVDGRRLARKKVRVTPRAAVNPTPSPSPTPTGGRLLFQDDFTGPAGQTFDHSKWQDWSVCTYNPSAAYGNIKCGDNETLDGAGHLRIPATPDRGSALSTATKFGFVYGEISAWIKNPSQDGYWPAFWTLNNDPNGVNHSVVGEADVMEGYTTWDDGYHAGVHNWSGSTTWGTPGDPVLGSTDLTKSFHKYTARFEPGLIKMYFDGQLVRTTKTSDGTGPWAFGPDITSPSWLILDLAIGGADGQQNPATQPATMLVDRVEVRGL